MKKILLASAIMTLGASFVSADAATQEIVINDIPFNVSSEYVFFWLGRCSI